MENTFSIRLLEERDLGQVAQLFDAYRQFYEQPSDLELAQRYISERQQQRQSVILVAANGNAQLAGFCQLYPTFCSLEAKPVYVLYDLFVAPQARGQGIASKLMSAAAVQARTAGMVRLDLSTAKTNLPAQALYTAQGWKRDNEFYTYSLGVKLD